METEDLLASSTLEERMLSDELEGRLLVANGRYQELFDAGMRRNDEEGVYGK
jgi:hypothetical protein